MIIPSRLLLTLLSAMSLLIAGLSEVMHELATHLDLPGRPALMPVLLLAICVVSALAMIVDYVETYGLLNGIRYVAAKVAIVGVVALSSVVTMKQLGMMRIAIVQPYVFWTTVASGTLCMVLLLLSDLIRARRRV